MALMLSKSLLDLPCELHHWIFNYLDIQTILCSIRLVCKELHAAANTYDKLKLNFSSISTSNSRSIANIVQTKNIISLALINKDQTQLSQVDLFFSLYRLDQFTRLQSMTLVEINGTSLDRCLQHIIRFRITTLSITLRHQTRIERDRIVRSISSTIAQSSLQNLNLNIDNLQITIDDTFRPIQNALRHLIIGTCTYQDYSRILSSCTRLWKFVVENGSISDVDIMTISSVPTSYLQLTSLTLYKWPLSIDQWDLFLSLTPSLTFLKIIFRKSPYLPLFNGNTWQQLIENRLVRLRTFEFFFSYDVSETSTNPSLESIINSFKTPFWLNEKHWIVTCEYHIGLSEIMLCTIPRYNTNKFERLIKCDSFSFNNCYHILARHWTGYPEYIYTDETLNKLDLSGTMITNAGAQYLADALENNTTLIELILKQNQMTMEATKYLVSILAKNKTLTKISIEQNKITDNVAQSLINALKYNKTLTTLNLIYDQIGPLQSEYFEDLLRWNTGLIDFNIGHNQLGDQGAQLIGNAIKKNKTLKILNLEENEIGDLGTKFLAEGLQNNKTLIILDLHGNMIGDQGAQYLADSLQKHATLTTLNLAYNQIGMSGIKYFTDALQKTTILSTLNLEGNNIERASVRLLANMLTNNTTLTTLILSNNQIWAEETKYLADALEINATLKTIDLRTNHIGSLGAKYLSNALQKNKTLTMLNLRRNGIDPSGGQYLADALRNNVTLIELILQNNEIGDLGIEYLARALSDNTKLKTLNLAQNNIGTAGAEHIINALRKNNTITMLNIQQNHLIDKNTMNLIDELLERNKKLLKQNI